MRQGSGIGRYEKKWLWAELGVLATDAWKCLWAWRRVEGWRYMGMPVTRVESWQ